jgi:hypothetical protein
LYIYDSNDKNPRPWVVGGFLLSRGVTASPKQQLDWIILAHLELIYVEIKLIKVSTPKKTLGPWGARKGWAAVCAARPWVTKVRGGGARISELQKRGVC